MKADGPVGWRAVLRRPIASLRLRLFAGTLVGVVAALLVAGLVLCDLFREQVSHQFDAGLRARLDQLTASFEVGADGRPLLVSEPADPRWRQPLSGLYWQIDGPRQAALLRSRSLWDTTLAVPADVAADGQVHVHETTGPGGLKVRVMERAVRSAEHPGPLWMLRVAQDTHEMDEAVSRFVGALLTSLVVLAVALLAAAVAQVAVGLAPLRSLQAAVTGLREGRLQRLDGEFPAELQPLIQDFNSVLDQNAQVVERARTQAGNLAHAIKTPLAVLANAAARPEAAPGELARLVEEQVEQARQQVNWHLARARAAASAGMPGLRTPVAPVVAGLVRVMSRVHAERALTIDPHVGTPLSFAGEEQDLQEMLGNLLDNACKWARTTVSIDVSAPAGPGPATLCLVVDDDGPGLPAQQHERMLARGARADEQRPGSGLGLAIVHDLARLYGGALRLSGSPRGGLRVQLDLPAI
ncbi:signal transduction histidine kinase [Sphaerotilus hippei]|uniref:histidine kinase n=1 Tax=Sphaerotilus hippei TaxID=744406 RepID=A0A318H7A6_9BURK|nr:sensor histidine kinase [Sphaerotilus hippei]PXW93654.1 signal transduction histidine kinase [Sphaerotilus hippei]